MKIAILSRNKSLYSTRRLVEAGESLGHDIDVIDTLHCYMDITSSRPTVRYHGEELPRYDAVIPRIGASITFYGTAVARQFEMMGTYNINESVAISRSRDKLRSMQLLSRRGIGLPRTGFASKADNIKDLIKNVGGAPLVIKLLEGTQGIGVVLADTAKAGGADIRCLVIGGKVVAAMKRQGAEGEFRSNLHRGGSAEVVKLSKAERETAVNAAKVMGLNFCGVDLLRSQNGPMVMEVNSSPGLEGIEKATGLDIATKVIEFIVKNTEINTNKPRVNINKTRGNG